VIGKNCMRSDVPDVRRRTGLRLVFRRPAISRILALAVLGISVAGFVHYPASAQDSSTNQKKEPTQTDSQKKPKLNFASIAFDPSDLRDPFLNPLLKEKEKGDREVDRGLPPPGIAGTYIAEAVLKGISIMGNDRLAIVKGNGNRAYFLREGDRLFDGYLKTIHRDSITLVRETKMRSGKIITQDVTKKLRTP
jgi:hypothetical protein